MLVVENNCNVFNWTLGGEVVPLAYSGELVVTFDPSKSNMAMVLGTPKKEVLAIYEFSGNNRKAGPVMDTTLYCAEVREFLLKLLAKAQLYIVAVEQAIMKKGNNYYHSSMVLTEIRGNLLNVFLQDFGIKVVEINNWVWKSHVLPEGYRSQREKGSKRFIRNYFPNSGWGNYFEADVTDCLCIYWYVCGSFCKNYTMFCNRVEPCQYKLDKHFYPNRMPLEDNMPLVIYNDRYSMDENLAYYANRLSHPFVMRMPVDRLEIEELYGKSYMFTIDMLDDEYAKVVCNRAC